MSDRQRVSPNSVRAASQMIDLELPPDRLDQLVTTLATYLENLDRLRTLNPGDCEPPAITYESEARS